MNKLLKPIILIVAISCLPMSANAWGFFCHRLINKQAVFILPPEMVGFYKKHMDYIVQHAVDPDKRSHAVEGEAVKHYIDIDYYGDKPFDLMPRMWKQAVEKYSEDTLQTYGILPWNIDWMMMRLTEAFKKGDVDQIINISANLGHYVGDANVPLHTTMFYDGRVLQQKGIHALWETRIPELLSGDFDFFTGRCQYVSKPLERAWDLVEYSHNEMDSVLNIYDSLMLHFDQSGIFVMEERGSVVSKQFSLIFCRQMEIEMRKMVYRKLVSSIYNVASFWYTAWVNAGQPDLDKLMSREVSKEHQKEMDELEYLWKNGKPKGRPNPEDGE